PWLTWADYSHGAHAGRVLPPLRGFSELSPLGSVRRPEVSAGSLLALRFRFRMAAARGGVLDLRIDLPADEKAEAGHVKPHHEDDDGAERAVGAAVGVEVVQVQAEAERSGKPEEDAKQRARRDPVPVLLFYVRAVVVHDAEGERHERECDRPLEHAPAEHERVMDAEAGADP